MIVTHTTDAPSNDQRRAEWAYRYAMAGFHHEPPPYVHDEASMSATEAVEAGYAAARVCAREAL